MKESALSHKHARWESYIALWVVVFDVGLAVLACSQKQIREARTVLDNVQTVCRVTDEVIDIVQERVTVADGGDSATE